MAMSDFMLRRIQQFDQGGGEYKNNRNVFHSSLSVF